MPGKKESSAEMVERGKYGSLIQEESMANMVDVDHEDYEHYGLARYSDHLKVEFFSLGFTAGISFQLLLICIFLLFVSSYKEDIGPLNELSIEYFPTFRMLFFFIFFFILYGLNLFIWRRYQIDYYSILDVTEEHSYQYVLRGVCSLAYIIFTCFLLYTLAVVGILPISKHLFPLLALIIPVLAYLSPFDKDMQACYGSHPQASQQRYDLIRNMGHILCAPFTQAKFIRTYISDILCSMPKAFTDIIYTGCLYSNYDWNADIQTCPISGTFDYFIVVTVFSSLPYFSRLLLCLRQYHESKVTKHLWNALKYMLSVAVTVLNGARQKTTGDTQQTFARLWFMVAIIATTYSMYWDYVNAWGLLNWNSKNFLLRDRLTFPKIYYYIAIVYNFFARLVWAINLSPNQPFVAQNVVLLFGCAELARRSMWSVLRVENIHINKNPVADVIKQSSL